MDDTTSAGLSAGPRRPNARGQGERLREEILSAAARRLGDLAEDEALSLRAVARAVSISPTSVYLYFPDRDTLVAAAMERCHAEMVRAADEGEAAHQDPAPALRARILALRINEPALPWPPFPEQADRFLAKVVGLALPAGETTAS